MTITTDTDLQLAADNLALALTEFRELLGADGVFVDADTRREFSDPYSPDSWTQYVPPAVLQPTTVDEIRGILRIANQYGVSVFVNSQGRNNGYGGSGTRHPGTVVVNLRRMNKVLEVNEELGYVVVEPGVSFNELHEYMKDRGYKIWVDCPDIGWGSLIGNALEHGIGYTINGDRAASVCGMEVVLPDGDLLRTGMGAMTNSTTWHVSKRGYGPTPDGIFMQSNFGVVTKMGFWCMPEPEYYMHSWIKLADDKHLPELIDALRPLLMDRTIPNVTTIFTSLGALSVAVRRSEIWQGEGAVPMELADKIAGDAAGLGAWNMRFALYGKENIVDANFANIQAALSVVPGVEVSGTKVRSSELDPATLDQSAKVQAGIPDMELLNVLNWTGASRPGHVCFASVLPARGEDARRIVDLVKARLQEEGFDYTGGFMANQRILVHNALIVYDTEDEAAVRRAYDMCRAMVKEAAALGYGEYRAHPDFMDLVADQFDFNDHAARRFNERLKDALDPNGILNPGKQGIWPKRLRDALEPA